MFKGSFPKAERSESLDRLGVRATAAATAARYSSPPAGPSRRGPIELDVRIKAEGMRLDRYLALNFQDFSRSIIQNAIDGGAVLVNGKPSKSSYKVRSRDHLRIQLPEPTHDGGACHFI